MITQARKLTAAIAALVIMLACSTALQGCASLPSTQKGMSQTASSSLSAPVQTVKKTYSDIPTPFPNLYCYSPRGPWNNVYNESKVIDWSEAGNYIGQAVTVEGYVDSIVYARSSNGSPYFFNFGGGAYAPGGFAAVVWSQDISKFDQYALRNFVEWSMSDQPVSCKFRISGTISVYNDRPQIVARDGSQIATQMDDGTWFSLLSDSSIDRLMDSLYR